MTLRAVAEIEWCHWYRFLVSHIPHSHIDWTSQHGWELAILEAADYKRCYTFLLMQARNDDKFLMVNIMAHLYKKWCQTFAPVGFQQSTSHHLKKIFCITVATLCAYCHCCWHICWHLLQDFPLNPKALSLGELYGEFNLSTNEWADGVLSSIMRQTCAGVLSFYCDTTVYCKSYTKLSQTCVDLHWLFYQYPNVLWRLLMMWVDFSDLVLILSIVGLISLLLVTIMSLLIITV